MSTPQATLPLPLKQYLSKLARHLETLPHAERQDILQELESQLYDQWQAGEDPEILAIRLGSAKDYAAGFLQPYQQELQDVGNLPGHLRLIWKKALIPGLLLMLGWIAVMWLNTFWIFGELLQKSEASLWQITQLLLAQLPAILVVVLPFALLWIVPLYLFSLATPGSPELRQLFRRPKVLLITLGLGLGTSLLAFGIQDLIVPSANRYTVEMLKTLMQVEHQQNCTDHCAETLQFNDEPDIRNVSAAVAWKQLSQQKIEPGKQQPILAQNLRDFYSKFSLPLSNLATAIFGLLTASLMLSGLFHPYYTLIVIGTLLPLGIWYPTYLWAYMSSSMQDWPLLSAFAPNLALTGLALIFLLGLLLPQRQEALQVN